MRGGGVAGWGNARRRWEEALGDETRTGRYQNDYLTRSLLFAGAVACGHSSQDLLESGRSRQGIG